MKKIYIKELTINNWRNINNQITLNFNENFNEIKGANGLGKTSILEAIEYMLFPKGSMGADFNKNQFDIDGNEKKEFPIIKLLLSFQNTNYKLETKNNKWFINNNEIYNRTKYLNWLNEFLNIDLDSLFVMSKPDYLLNNFLKTQKATDKQKIRNYIIQVLNISNDQKIDIDKFETNVKNKEIINLQKKEKTESLKEKKNSIKEIKNLYPNIENHNSINNLELKKELENIIKKIDKYKEIQNNISKIDIQIKDIEIKINNLENMNNVNNTNYYNKPWINIWLFILLLLLGIIPGLIYLAMCFSNKNNNNYNFDNAKDVSIELNNYYKEIKNLKNERETLSKNEFYQTTDINELFNKKTQIDNQINANDNSEEEFKNIKIRYSILSDDLNKLEEEIDELKEKENKINEENKIIASQTDHILKKVFPELSISLFNEKDVEDIVIKKDGVPFKYLNYAAKQNIIFQFNEKLYSNKIIPFFLIDHAESINKIYKPNNNQIIICKVSSDNGLILNGKNIY